MANTWKEVYTQKQKERLLEKVQIELKKLQNSKGLKDMLYDSIFISAPMTLCDPEYCILGIEKNGQLFEYFHRHYSDSHNNKVSPKRIVEVIDSYQVEPDYIKEIYRKLNS